MPSSMFCSNLFSPSDLDVVVVMEDAEDGDPAIIDGDGLSEVEDVDLRLCSQLQGHDDKENDAINEDENGILVVEAVKDEDEDELEKETANDDVNSDGLVANSDNDIFVVELVEDEADEIEDEFHVAELLEDSDAVVNVLRDGFVVQTAHEDNIIVM